MNPCGFRTGLPKYLNGALRPEPERSVILHLESCPTCRRELARLRKLAMLVDAALYRPDDVEEFQATFLERFDREAVCAAEPPVPLPAEPVLGSGRPFWKPALIPLAAAGVLSAVLLRPAADSPAPAVNRPPAPVAVAAPVAAEPITERGSGPGAVVPADPGRLLEHTVARDVELLDAASPVAAADGNG